MSIVYDKSISSKYKQYFEQVSNLVKPFRNYSLKEKRIIPKNITGSKSWETGQAGIPIAWNKEDKLVTVDHTDSHTLVIGPTGSKKSRLIAMPYVYILGSVGESMIISDPKAEIFNRTAFYLKEKGYDIFVLNLRSPLHGKCWNPLAIPYNFFCRGEIDKAYEFVNDIAENLIQSGKSQSDPFWDNSAGSFFFGLVLLLFKYCKDNNKGNEYVHIGNVIQLRNVLFDKSKKQQKEYLWKYVQTDTIIAASLIGTVETAKDTQAGILSVFDQKIRMFSIQPNLMDMLSRNDIDFAAIGNRPTAVFLITPDEKTGYHGLITLFIKQSYEYIINMAQLNMSADEFHVGKTACRVNYLLDEFSSLPTIKDFPAMITASRSRNIRFTLIVQSKHQLMQRYGDEAETIQTNCNNWIFLTSRELQLLEELSSMCGKTADNAKSVLSVAMLQRLDKEEGEALLLSERRKPCITRLPDIDFYDGGHFAGVSVMAREVTELKILDFQNLVKENEVETEDSVQKFRNIDLDSLMADIDRKIAELDKEEEALKRDEAKKTNPSFLMTKIDHVLDNIKKNKKEQFFQQSRKERNHG